MTEFLHNNLANIIISIILIAAVVIAIIKITKAYGSLTDDIRNNLCENCELYQEVKITKAAEVI